MDGIYGHRPASNGREGGLDSATSLLESLVKDNFFSASENGSVTPTDAMSAPGSSTTLGSSTTPEPVAPSTPIRSEASIPRPAAVSALATGRRKRPREQEHLTVLREMQTSDVEQHELNRAQRERHLQMALDDAASSRKLEVALRREEIAAMSSFNQAFLGTLSQLVQALKPYSLLFM